MLLFYIPYLEKHCDFIFNPIAGGRSSESCHDFVFHDHMIYRESCRYHNGKNTYFFNLSFTRKDADPKYEKIFQVMSIPIFLQLLEHQYIDI